MWQRKWNVEWKSDLAGWIPYMDGPYATRAEARKLLRRVPRQRRLEYDHRIAPKKYQYSRAWLAHMAARAVR